jgi:dephospho-CoA kinase
MLEAGWRDLVDELWVTSVPVPTAQCRLMQRNNLTEEQALARINAQVQLILLTQPHLRFFFYSKHAASML